MGAIYSSGMTIGIRLGVFLMLMDIERCVSILYLATF